MTEYIPFGQGLITEEQYLADKSFYDGTGLINTVGSEPPQDPTNSLTNLGLTIYDLISKIKAMSIEYEFNAGSSETNLLDNEVVITDDYHLAAWYVYNTGLIDDISMEQVNDAKNFILDPNILNQVSPASTSSDSLPQKIDIINAAQMGDIVLFDTYQRNGTAAIYTGEGHFITIFDDNGLTTGNFWTSDEFGNYDYSGWVQKFNGTVLRIPRLNEDDYKWYVETSGISN